MIKITSLLQHDLNVPLRPDLGTNSPMVLIKGASAQGAAGITETDRLDSVTIARLTHAYGKRPMDGNGQNAQELDGDGRPRFEQIGLLTFTQLDGSPLGEKPKSEDKSGNGKRAA